MASAALPAPLLPPVIGHRGAAASAPENTIAGFRVARALGCAWVEFDVRLTSDGALIVLHDSRLDRTTDGSGRAAALPLAVARRYDAGSWFDPAFAGERVPTLGEALDITAELGLGANVEIKADARRARATGIAVAAELSSRAASTGPVLLSSFLPAAIAAVRDEAPHIPRGILFGAVPPRWRSFARELGCSTIHADHRRLGREVAAQVSEEGYPLLVYTVNEPERARLLFDWGVSAVFSDAPDRLLAVIPRGASRQAEEPHLQSGTMIKHGASP